MSSSEDSDCEPRQNKARRKRKVAAVEDGNDQDVPGTSNGESMRRKRILRYLRDSDDSDSSGSSIDIHPKKGVPRVTSGSESSDSFIVKISKGKSRVLSESSDDSNSSQWETDDESEKIQSAAKSQPDTGFESDSSDGQSEKCPICLLRFKKQEIGTPETCDHMFCIDCLLEWSKNMNTCPVDRQEYRLILVRKNINGKIVRQVPVEAPNPQNEIDITEDPTFCEICGSSDREDRMLMCDGCDLGFHLECLTPPLNEVPVGSWYCSDCNPDEVLDPEIELYEVQMLLEDADTIERPIRRRRREFSPRLIPRTRQSERVRRRIASNRIRNIISDEHSLQSPVYNSPRPQFHNNSSVSSSTMTTATTTTTTTTTSITTTTRRATRKKRRKRKKKSMRFKLVYEIDEKTGETIVRKRKRCKRRRKPKSRRVVVPKTVKKRLALQLGICPLRTEVQNCPEMRANVQSTSLGLQRQQAGIPMLHLFGPRDELTFFSEDDEGEIETAGSGLLVRSTTRNRLRQQQRIKQQVSMPSVTSSTDILGDILDTQSKLHSKNTVFSLDKNGKFNMEKGAKGLDFQNFNKSLRKQPTSNENSDNTPSSSDRQDTQTYTTNSAVRESVSFTIPTSTVPGSGGFSGNEDALSPEYSSSYETSLEKRDEKKKSDDSDSDVDIYSDIETVSTSNKDPENRKMESPPPLPPDLMASLNFEDGDGDNDSEPDMVIDTEKAQSQAIEENEESTREVTSTVDLATQPVHSTSKTNEDEADAEEEQQQEPQSSNQDYKKDEDEEDSEDGCPNFSIYSKESITLAKNTDISLEGSNQVGEISSSPAGPVEEEKEKKKSSGGLYSDSEDESVVKKNDQFALNDIINMTEDISEEERSYTPCLDERPAVGAFREGLEGLDTEMISDEDRNDFDETQDFNKTASDGGDALEINAKESELDFTRPEDYEEGEIIDKNKTIETAETTTTNEEPAENPENDIIDTVNNDNNENKKEEKEEEPPIIITKTTTTVTNNKESEPKDSPFKKLSKSNKVRNYRDRDKDKDRERSTSKEKEKSNDKSYNKENRRKKARRKEIQRYNVRALIDKKPPRSAKDKFGRDIRRTKSRSRSYTPPHRSSATPRGRSATPTSPPPLRRRSLSKSRRSLTKERQRRRSSSRGRRKKRARSRRRSNSKSRSRSRPKKRQQRSLSRRRKSRDRSKTKAKKRSRSRSRFRTPSPKRRRMRDWATPSMSRSRTPERHLTPSWTPPRIESAAIKPHKLTVILPNDTAAVKKKKEKKKKTDKKKEERTKKKRREKTPPPSKEVFASGDNILVSVSFNKENESRDVTNVAATTTKKKQREEKRKKSKTKKSQQNKDTSAIKPVAIIDLERSPFKELTPSPKDVIVLTDSDNEEKDKVICDSSSQQVDSPERNNYQSGPKTPPEPQVKFILAPKPVQMRAITNPLHEEENDEENQEEEEIEVHKGPNTPPEPPNSPPSSPDVYDPFEPTKSRSPTPEVPQQADDAAVSEEPVSLLVPPLEESHTPPLLADIQPADSQSSIQASPDLDKSPPNPIGVIINQQVQEKNKPIAQTTPFSSVPTTSTTPTSNSVAILTNSRINILNSTSIASSLPQRTHLAILPNVVTSRVKNSPTKLTTTTTSTLTRKNSGGGSTRQNGSDGGDVINFDSPYSPGSSDYEDLFDPPSDTATTSTNNNTAKPAPSKPPTKAAVKSPTKTQNAFDALFGSPFNKTIKAGTQLPKDKATNMIKYKKGPITSPTKGLGSKQVGVKLDEDSLKILDDLPSSAVEMQVKDKFLKKLNRQERVVEEVKLVLKPHYNKKHINKEEYKDILRRAVPKICHNKSGEINPTKIKNLIEAYVKKIRHSKKVTSSSSINPQKI